jgi:alpha-L-rhamnosidase
VSASYDSVRGTIAASWQRSPTGLKLDVTVPAGAVGTVYVPAPSARVVSEVGAGRAIAAASAAGVRYVGVEGGRVVYEIGSGRYQFRVASGLAGDKPKAPRTR